MYKAITKVLLGAFLTTTLLFPYGSVRAANLEAEHATTRVHENLEKEYIHNLEQEISKTTDATLKNQLLAEKTSLISAKKDVPIKKIFKLMGEFQGDPIKVQKEWMKNTVQTLENLKDSLPKHDVYKKVSQDFYGQLYRFSQERNIALDSQTKASLKNGAQKDGNHVKTAEAPPESSDTGNNAGAPIPMKPTTPDEPATAPKTQDEKNIDKVVETGEVAARDKNEKLVLNKDGTVKMVKVDTSRVGFKEAAKQKAYTVTEKTKGAWNYMAEKVGARKLVIEKSMTDPKAAVRGLRYESGGKADLFSKATGAGNGYQLGAGNKLDRRYTNGVETVRTLWQRVVVEALGMTGLFIGFSMLLQPLTQPKPPSQERIPGTHKVAIYQDENYEGEVFYLAAGSFPDVRKIPIDGMDKRIKNDWINSIKILYQDNGGDILESNYDPFRYIEMTIYEDTNYQGNSFIIRSDVPSLKPFNFDGKISSIKIRIVTKKTGLYLYDHTGLNGTQAYFGPSKVKNLSNFNIKGKQAMSLDMGGGTLYSATVYSEENFGGIGRIYRERSYDLDKDEIKGKSISSLEVAQEKGTRDPGVYLFESTNFNGKVAVLKESGVYKDLSTLKDQGFRSIEVVGNYEVEPYEEEYFPGLTQAGDVPILGNPDTEKSVKAIVVKQTEVPQSDEDLYKSLFQ